MIAYFEDNNSSGNSGRDYNQNYSPIPDSLQSNDSKQYFEMYSINDGVDRYSKEYIMERENFFHKPQVNFNWYSKLNDNIDLSTVFYWSGGKGGGTGTYGSPKWGLFRIFTCIRFRCKLGKKTPDTMNRILNMLLMIALVIPLVLMKSLFTVGQVLILLIPQP